MISLPASAIHEGKLILVNAAHPIASAAPDDLCPLAAHPNIHLRKEAANALTQALNALAHENAIVPLSGYRSNTEQQRLYADSLRNNGPVFTRQFVALPGTSEHETGLAIDLALAQPSIDPICPSFPYTGICQLFRTLAPQYGFIERYPAGKETITGIAHEPWHFRYVGSPHAQLITLQGFCLEDYLHWLRRYTRERPLRTRQHHHSDALIYFQPWEENNLTDIVTLPQPHTISGNNDDGFIITIWNDGYD